MSIFRKAYIINYFYFHFNDRFDDFLANIKDKKDTLVKIQVSYNVIQKLPLGGKIMLLLMCLAVT